MVKRILLVVLAFFAVVAILAFLKYGSVKKGMAMGALMAPQPAAVSTLVVKPQPWEPVISAVGSLRAVNGVTLSTDLAGIVTNIAFESGAPVKKGDMLMELDTQQEEAQLKAAQAKLDFARIDLGRKKDLIEKKAISTSDLDTAQTQLLQAQANVEDAKALIGRKHIVAPFDGIIGIRQVSPGQYMNPGAMVAPLQSVDPIYVEFALPQQHLPSLTLGRKLRIHASASSPEAFDGEITAVDSRVDEATRNITVQGTLANPDHKLLPGMFVNVDVLLPTQENVLSVPTSSVSYATFGDSVYIVQPGKDEKGQPLLDAHGQPQHVVDQVTVTLGPTRGDQVTILSGLQPGSEVVTGGVFRLQKGAPVQINNSVQPGNDPNPKPPES